MSVQANYQVDGMTCGHCVQAVSAELSRLPGVLDVTVDLASGQVTITSDAALAVDDVGSAVDEAGYTLAGQG
jgi:copper chaperone CopZ